MSAPSLPPSGDAEWLEADGLGGFASGTVSGVSTRRYHALLLTARTPPTGRMVLVNGIDAWLETPERTIPLTAHRYAPDVVCPEGRMELAAFEALPWPKWCYRAEGGYEVEMELLVRPGHSATFIGWKLTKAPVEVVRLVVRPLFSGRDFHALHQVNDQFRFKPVKRFGMRYWRPYDDVPGVVVKSSGSYTHQPQWHTNFVYSEECRRGLDCLEDLAAPGLFHFDLVPGDSAELAFATMGHESALYDSLEVVKHREANRRRRFPSPVHQAADAYLVRRGKGATIIAGYPWFGDWGRDTFIAMRGLCLSTGRFHEAEEILIEWASKIDGGMMPNRFRDCGGKPEYTSVDSALWFVVVVRDFFDLAGSVDPAVEEVLRDAVRKILEGYRQGTRHGIRMDDDGLLSCGAHGLQLTWMDAKAGDWVVTPRIGKPVEIQALWINALAIGSGFHVQWRPIRERALSSFREKFWNEDASALYDVVDVDFEPGRHDASIRPNMIFAIGGLPWALLEGKRARRALKTVEGQLLTPFGLRTLAPGSDSYASSYGGDVWRRDGAYHQGTVWPWLMGPFVDAWLHVHGASEIRRREAETRFLQPLREQLGTAGLGHISEILDAEVPHIPQGCPFQAWSLGEFLRIEERLKAPER